MNETGKLVVISGPSGAGKSTVISKVVNSDANFVYSVSATTRKPRNSEINGVDYIFIEKQEFERMISDGKLLEYAKYVDNYYGTPESAVIANITAGRDVVFDIEVQGAMQIKNKCPSAILIFILPSDFSEIEKRLRCRGTDSDEIIYQRVQTARAEYLMAPNYEYIVINDDTDTAVKEIKSIVIAEKCRYINRKKLLSEEY